MHGGQRGGCGGRRMLAAADNRIPCLLPPTNEHAGKLWICASFHSNPPRVPDSTGWAGKDGAGCGEVSTVRVVRHIAGFGVGNAGRSQLVLHTLALDLSCPRPHVTSARNYVYTMCG